MVVGDECIKKSVEFVSYKHHTSLCYGLLTLRIDGEIVKFGVDIDNTGEELYPKFWTSGGSCGFKNGYSKSYIEKDEWIISANKLPEKYQKYAYEIDEIFNENVEEGCCGACL